MALPHHSFQQPVTPLRPPDVSRARTWFYLLDLLRRSATFSRLFRAMAVVGLYSAAVVYAFDMVGYQPQITIALHSILGITLGLLLVIRTNTAYDRWWEGRRLVGNLVNNTRLLALKFDAMLPGAQYVDVRHDLAAWIVSYAYSLRDHLRGHPHPDRLTDLDPLTRSELHGSHHLPNRIAHRIHHLVNALRRDGHLGGEEYLTLDAATSELTHIVGACERIKNSPLPGAYNAHLKLFIMIYVLTVPLGLIDSFGYYAAPAAMLVFYAMAGLELIAEEIEDPFGTDANDIPMDRIVETIRHNVYEILVPEAVAPIPTQVATVPEVATAG